MALQTPPALTALGSATYPHRHYHGVLTENRYAHPNGDNTKDGLTWGTAKQDIGSAYDALPATGGTVFFAHGTLVDAVNTDRGLWIVGPMSGDYASPPTGWRQQKSGNFTLQGVGGISYRKSAGADLVTTPTSSTDRNKPRLWFQGTNTAIHVNNVFLRHPAVAIRIGINAAQTDRSINTSGIIFNNVITQLHQDAANGPGVDMGYCFWVYFIDSHLSDNRTPNTLTAATTSGTIATFTTALAHNFLANEYVFVHEVTPAGYNGGWKVISTPTSTTFTADIGSSPGAGSVFGHVHPLRNDRHCAVLADGRLGASPGPFFYNTTIDGTGIRYWRGNTTWGLTLNETISEGDFTHPIGPIAEILNGDGNGTVIVNGLQRADVGTANGAEGGTVHINPETPPSVISVMNAYGVVGPATILNMDEGSQFSDRNLASQKQLWLGNQKIYGAAHDSARRLFSPSAVRIANIGLHDPSAWTGTATLTTGKSAPDGTTNAAELSSASGEKTMNVGDTGAITLAVGDSFFAGVWARCVQGTKPVLRTMVMQSPHTNNHFHTSGTNLVAPDLPLGFVGGGWEWLTVYGTVTAAGTPASQVNISVYCDASAKMEFFAPVFFRVPVASAWTESEIAEFALHLPSWQDGFAAGVVPLLRSQSLGFTETTDPTAPGTNRAILYAKDNGSGKTQLVVRFPTGAVQVLATEP